MENTDYKPKYPVQTLGKALDILNYIKEHPSAEGVTISEISRELGIVKSGVHRMLDTLMAYKFVEKSSDSSTSWLGALSGRKRCAEAAYFKRFKLYYGYGKAVPKLFRNN